MDLDKQKVNINKKSTKLKGADPNLPEITLLLNEQYPFDQPVDQPVTVDAIQQVTLALLNNDDAVAFAAPQFGIMQPFFVIKNVQQKGVLIVIDPQIKEYRGRRLYLTEKCMSFPSCETKTKRRRKITAKFKTLDTDTEGKPEFRDVGKVLLKDTLAVIFQHEYDHLRGKTIISREQLR